MDTLPHIESLYELIAFGLFVAYQLYINHCADKQTKRRKRVRDLQYWRLRARLTALEKKQGEKPWT